MPAWIAEAGATCRGRTEDDGYDAILATFTDWGGSAYTSIVSYFNRYHVSSPDNRSAVRWKRLLLISFLGWLAGLGAHAQIIADFEAPAYTADQDIDGVDGWSRTDPAAQGWVIPSPTTGYQPPLVTAPRGAQAFVLSAAPFFRGYRKALPPGVSPADGSVMSWYMWTELASNAADCFLSNNLNTGATPLGVGHNTAGNFRIWGAASPGSGTDTLVPFPAGTWFRVEIEIDFTNQRFDAYVTDITNGGARLLVGSDNFAGSAPLADFLDGDAGVFLTRSGGSTAFDHLALPDEAEEESKPRYALTALPGETEGHDVVLTWESGENQRYTVQRTFGLDDPFTNLYADLASTPPVNTIVDWTNLNQDVAFYRVAVEETPQNLAQGRTYTFSQPPNYSLCTGPEDVTDLTDGIRVTSPGVSFWGNQGCVGWVHPGAVVSVTIDLGQVEPICGFSFNTAAGSSGVAWPAAIQFWVSEDGVAYHPAAELLRAMNRPLPPGYLEYDLVRLRTCSVPTKGRYVRVDMRGSGAFLFCDEIEVYRGPDGLLTQPIPPPLPNHDFNPILPLHLTRQGVYLRIRRDIESVNQLIESADPFHPSAPVWYRELADARLGLDALLFPSSVAGFRSIVPVNALHARPFRVYAALLRDKGAADLSLWHSPPYQLLGLFEEPGPPLTSLQVAMMQGERRAEVFNLTNATDQDRTVLFHIDGLPGGTNPAYLSPHRVDYVDTREGRAAASALTPLTASGGNYSCTVPAGMTRQVWLSCAPNNVTPGDHAGQIHLASGTWSAVIDIHFLLADLQMPADPNFGLGMWDYIYDKGNSVNGSNQAALRSFVLNDPLFNAVWCTSSTIPFPAGVDGAGNLVGTIDYTEWDAFVSYWPNKKYYFGFAAFTASSTFFGHAQGTPAFDNALGQWAAAWAAHNATLGLSPGQAGILFVDEPGDSTWFQATYNFSRAFRLGSSDITVFNDPTGHQLGQPFGFDLIDESDIVSPTRSHFDIASTTIQDRLRQLPAEGKQLWFYQASGPARMFDPAYYRVMPWHCYEQGATGSGYWAYTDSGQATSWNEYANLNGVAYTPVYIGQNTVNTSKHWEALREGIMDYVSLEMLADRIDELDTAGISDPALEDARTLLAQVASDVVLQTKTVYGTTYYGTWTGASAIAESGRIDVRQALVDLLPLGP